MNRGTFRWLLAAIVAACSIIALVWALVVPAFQEPDELAHLDYAFALYDAGRPFVVPGAVPGTAVTPQAHYLAVRARYRQMRYNPLAREPVTAIPLFWLLDKDTAGPHASHRIPAFGSRMPYAMFWYPFPYYAAIAATMRIADLFSHDSLAGAFVAARLFNVACLVPTLLLASGVFRRTGLDRTTTLLATLAIGAFPLTSWVAGYVQPDNLSLLFMTGTLYAMLRWRERPASFVRTSTLAALVAMLFLTKYQYGISAWLAAVILVGSRLLGAPSKSSVPALAAVSLLPIAAFLAALAYTPVSHGPGLRSIGESATAHFGDGTLSMVSGTLVSTLYDSLDAYCGGIVFDGFWFDFGFRSGALVTGLPHRIVEVALILLTFAFLVTFGSLMIRRWLRIARIVRERSVAAGVRCAGAGVSANLYIATTAVLFIARAATDDRLQLLGRYWLPVIVPAMALVLADVPRLIAYRRQRTLVVRSLAGTMAFAVVLAGLVDLHSMYADFYVSSDKAPAYASLARVEGVRNDVVSRGLDEPVVLDDARPIYARGFAVDGSTGLPAEHVVLLIDGLRRYAATTGLPRPDLAAVYHDDAIANCGFEVRLPAHALDRGVHHFRFQIPARAQTPAVRVGRDVEIVISRTRTSA